MADNTKDLKHAGRKERNTSKIQFLNKLQNNYGSRGGGWRRTLDVQQRRRGATKTKRKLNKKKTKTKKQKEIIEKSK